MEKILLLGGSTQQIPAIECAKNLGYETILCDYLPDNPGRNIADKFYCLSTTNKDEILAVASKEGITGVLAYASDPAAPTAAYVAESLNLPSNPYRSVEILAYKDKFRKFLLNNNFNCPIAEKYQDFSILENNISKFNFPVIIKPVDSSGSKGVIKVEDVDLLKTSFNYALSFSKSKTVIVEEFIEKNHDYMVGGDCFVINGKVEFWGLLNCHRDENVNNLVPVGKSYPVLIKEENIKQLKKEVQRIVEVLGLNFGGFNLEIMFDKNDNLYFIEMGPRNGGNMIPDFLKVVTGIDLVEASVKMAMGKNDLDLAVTKKSGFYATHNIHSASEGVYQDVVFDSNLAEKVFRKEMYVKENDTVYFFDNSSKSLGIVFFEFDTKKELKSYMEKINKLIKIHYK